MESKNITRKEEKPVLPHEGETASGGSVIDQSVLPAGAKTGQPLEVRQVIQKQGSLSELEKGDKKEKPAAELDWALARMPGRRAKLEPVLTEAGAEASGTGKEPLTRSEERLRSFGRVGQWFQTLCWINIPVFGFFYVLVLSLRKKTPPQKRSFAIAYLLYRMLVLMIALTILYVLYRVGLSFLAEILSYAGLAAS